MAEASHLPESAAPAALVPRMVTLPAACALARVYYASSAHPLAWNGFRSYGPLNFRWDHHLPTAADEPQEQERSVLYAAANAVTCLAETFQATRRIDRVYQAPWLVVFKILRPLCVLDLTGEFATQEAAAALQTGSRARARTWARDLYESFPAAEGVLYASAAHAGASGVALNERALRMPLFAPHPEFHRALADDLLLDPLKEAAQVLGYALR